MINSQIKQWEEVLYDNFDLFNIEFSEDAAFSGAINSRDVPTSVYWSSSEMVVRYSNDQFLSFSIQLWSDFFNQHKQINADDNYDALLESSVI